MQIENAKEKGSYSNHKLFLQILNVLKMRLLIENITGFTDDNLLSLVKQNINLLDIHYLEIGSLIPFVDDLIEIIKNDQQQKVNLSQSIHINQLTNSNFTNISQDESNLSFNKTVLSFNRKEYSKKERTMKDLRKKRTIELVLDKPKMPTKPMRFNLYEKKDKTDPEFYADGTGGLLGTASQYDLGVMQDQIIDEILKKSSSGK